MTEEARKSDPFSMKGREGSLREQSVRGGMVTMSSQALELVLQVGSMTVLARLLLPEHYGLISMVTALVAVAARFADLGLEQATIQRKDITHEQVSNLFWVNVTIGCALMVIVAAASPLVASFYKEARLGPIAIAISLNFLLAGLTVQHQALLRRRMQFTVLAGIQIGTSILSAAVAIVLAVADYGYWALVWREVVKGLLMVVGIWIWCPWIPGFPNRRVPIGHLLKFARYITGFNVVVFATVSLDQILIGRFHGPGELGIYRQAYQLITTPISQLYMAFTRVAEPALSSIQDDHERYRKYFSKMLMALSAATMPLIMFIVIYAEDVVLVMLGKNWVGVTEVLRILALAVLLLPATETTGLLLQTTGQTKRYFNMGVATSFVRLCAFSIGAWWGVLGVAYAHVAVTCVAMVPRVYVCVRETPMSLSTFLSAVAKPSMATFGMTMALVLWNAATGMTGGWARLAMAVPVAGGAYLLTWMMTPGAKEDLRELVGEIMSGLQVWKGFRRRGGVDVG